MLSADPALPAGRGLNTNLPIQEKILNQESSFSVSDRWMYVAVDAQDQWSIFSKRKSRASNNHMIFG
jgi:hypothetical protein